MPTLGFQLVLALYYIIWYGEWWWLRREVVQKVWTNYMWSGEWIIFLLTSLQLMFHKQPLREWGSLKNNFILIKKVCGREYCRLLLLQHVCFCMNSFEMGRGKKSYFSSFYLQKREIKINGERFIVGRASKEEIFIRFWLNKKALNLMTIEENALTFRAEKKKRRDKFFTQ